MIDYYKLEETYDDVSNFVCGFAIVTISNKCGIINMDGEEICEIKYDWIVNINGLFFKVLFNNKWGIINNKGDVFCGFARYIRKIYTQSK